MNYFATWPKSQDKNWNILRTKRAFELKQKHFSSFLKGLQLPKMFQAWECAFKYKCFPVKFAKFLTIPFFTKHHLHHIVSAKYNLKIHYLLPCKYIIWHSKKVNCNHIQKNKRWVSLGKHICQYRCASKSSRIE